MKPVLHILSGPALARTYPLTHGTHVLGRGSDADIQIPSKEISRRHAQFVVTDQAVMVEDLKSSNGTLVQKKRIQQHTLKHKEQIVMGDVLIEYRDEDRVSNTNFDTPRTLYVQATKIVTQTLKPKNLWPYFTLLFAVTLMAITFFAYSSFKSLLLERLTQDAMAQAQTLTRYLAEKNRQNVFLQNHLLLDTESILNEKGVVEAMIISNNGRVLAPVGKMDQSDRGPFVMEALNQTSDALLPPSPVGPNGQMVFVHPIRSYDDRQGKYVTVGVAKLIFSTTKAIGELPETKQLLWIMLLISLGLSAALGWLAAKTLSLPLLALAEKIQRWRTGQIYQTDPPPFQDWSPLYEAIERTIEDAQHK
jgi:pSer/pThr/pTyr-binding forkhead associated (FHA) protein